MRQTKLSFAIPCLAVVCLTWFSHEARAEEALDPKITEKELRDVVDQLNDLDVWFSGAASKRKRWQAELQEKDKQVEETSRAVSRANEVLEAARASLTDLQEERKMLLVQRAAQAHKIGEHVSAAHRMSGEDLIKLLLNQKSPEQFERMMRYHRYFSEARLASLGDYQATLEALTVNEQHVATRLGEEQARQQTLAEHQSKLVDEREQRKRLIADLQAEVEDRTDEQQRLQADRERLEALLAELRRRTTELDGKQFAARKGTLPWPITGNLRAGFGQSRADGRMEWHGVVVAASEGSPVAAVYRGQVVFSDWLRGFGLLLIIDHGSGFMTLYGHADALLKRTGDWVESGEPIAHAGRSGGQSASGLYFEVRQNGAARDPVAWLAKR